MDLGNAVQDDFETEQTDIVSIIKSNERRTEGAEAKGQVEQVQLEATDLRKSRQ